MRVIAGSLKGRRLASPAPGDRSVRPTSDRAREALFSLLEPRPRSGFLDLFAGTGAVGLEAFSRGHLPVACVECVPAALKLLRGNLEGTPVQLVAMDARRLAGGAYAGLGIVFADPPYADSARLLAELGTRIRGWLAADGLLVWECRAEDRVEPPAGFRIQDRRVYGAAAFHFLVPST